MGFGDGGEGHLGGLRRGARLRGVAGLAAGHLDGQPLAFVGLDREVRRLGRRFDLLAVSVPLVGEGGSLGPAGCLGREPAADLRRSADLRRLGGQRATLDLGGARGRLARGGDVARQRGRGGDRDPLAVVGAGQPVRPSRGRGYRGAVAVPLVGPFRRGGLRLRGDRELPSDLPGARDARLGHRTELLRDRRVLGRRFGRIRMRRSRGEQGQAQNHADDQSEKALHGGSLSGWAQQSAPAFLPAWSRGCQWPD